VLDLIEEFKKATFYTGNIGYLILYNIFSCTTPIAHPFLHGNVSSGRRNRFPFKIRHSYLILRR
jgi:hypothetical protein